MVDVDVFSNGLHFVKNPWIAFIAGTGFWSYRHWQLGSMKAQVRELRAENAALRREVSELRNLMPKG